jgi:predicted acyltransferase
MTTATSTGPVASTPSPQASQPSGDRLLSLDALRGFDMFWIVGGEGLVLALAGIICGGNAPDWLSKQLEHPEWHGFTFYDLIFPLFIFLAGVAMPFSFAKYLERGEGKGRLYWRILRRAVLLVLMGLIYQGLLTKGFTSSLRYPSVLGRIGLAYFFAALITLHTSTRGRVASILVLLLGYWAAMMWIPVPDFGAGNLEPGKTLADYFDRSLLPGKLYRGDRDPEGLLSTIPAIATALLGVLAGQWLRRPQAKGLAKAVALLAAGVICLALGALWNQAFPINKNLWTSSFVLWTGGWSLLLLGLFHLLIDVWGWRRWAFFFVVIGANAITIYMAQRWIDYDALGQLLFAHAPIHTSLLPNAGLLMKWFALYVLYRQRIFLRL